MHTGVGARGYDLGPPRQIDLPLPWIFNHVHIYVSRTRQCKKYGMLALSRKITIAGIFAIFLQNLAVLQYFILRYHKKTFCFYRNVNCKIFHAKFPCFCCYIFKIGIFLDIKHKFWPVLTNSLQNMNTFCSYN